MEKKVKLRAETLTVLKKRQAMGSSSSWPGQFDLPSHRSPSSTQSHSFSSVGLGQCTLGKPSRPFEHSEKQKATL